MNIKCINSNITLFMSLLIIQFSLVYNRLFPRELMSHIVEEEEEEEDLEEDFSIISEEVMECSQWDPWEEALDHIEPFTIRVNNKDN